MNISKKSHKHEIDVFQFEKFNSMYWYHGKHNRKISVIKIVRR